MKKILAILSALLCVSLVSAQTVTGPILSPSTVGVALRSEIASPLPTALGWNLAGWVPSTFGTSTLGYVPDDISPYADVGITPEALFDLYSTARSSPATTYYVNFSTGNDGNNCLSSGSPCKSCNHAQSLANTGAVKATIFIAATAEYVRAQDCTFGLAGGPTVDTALIATGGRVNMTTRDAMTWTGTGVANTYLSTLSGAERVVDTINLNRYGNYSEFKNVATQALVNATPGSWSLVAGTIYVQRADGLAPTDANTRAYRQSTPNIIIAQPVNIFVGGATSADGFDFEGGSTAIFRATNASDPGADHAAVVSNSTFKYGGGVVSTTTIGFSDDSFRGIVACFNCAADASETDGFNTHALLWSATPYFLIVNSSASDNGRDTNQSNNCGTSHDTTVSIFAGLTCWGNHGGSIRSVNASKALISGCAVSRDFGDKTFGGSIVPTAIRVDDTATYWVDGCHIDMPGGAVAMSANSAGATINYRNMLPFRQPVSGLGTIQGY